MSDDLDKFVLQYQVDLKDSIAKLQALQEAMNKTDKGGEKASGAVKDLAANFRGLNSTLDAAGSAFGRVMSAAAPVAGAMTAIGLAVKFAVDQVAEYNNNLKIAYATGIDLTQLEGVRRSLTANGITDRGAVDAGLGNIASLVQAARINPMGTEAYKLRQMGGNPFQSVQENMGSIGANFQGMDKGKAEALGMAYGGLDPRMVNAMREQGKDSGEAKLTDQEVANLVQYKENLKELNEAFNKGKSSIKEFAVTTSASLIDFFAKLPEAIGRTLSPSKNGGWLAWMRKMGESAEAVSGPVSDDHPANQDLKKALDTADKKTQERVDQSKKEKVQQQQVFDAGAMYMRSAALFAASVNSFTHVIGEQEMNAILAGEAGAASGAGGSPSSPGITGNGAQATFLPATTGGGSGNWTANQYAPFIKKAAETYGLDPQLLHAVMMVESHGKNGQYSETGAGGLMQVTKGNWKKLGGGKDVMDPETNIMVGAQILNEQIGLKKGDMQAALKGYNGNSDPNYIPKIMAEYGGPTLGNGHWVPGTGKTFKPGGPAFDSVRYRLAADAIASGMHVNGVTGEQILQGQIQRGDADVGYQRAMTAAKAATYQAYSAAYAPGITDQMRKEAMQKFSNAAMAERSLENYGSQVLSKTKAGGQALTAGQTVYVDASNLAINVTGGIADEAEFKRRVTQILQDGVQQALNEQADHNKS